MKIYKFNFLKLEQKFTEKIKDSNFSLKKR